MEEKNSPKKERKMRDSGIPWIGKVPEGWEVMKIGHCFRLKNEKNFLPENKVQLLSLYTGIGVFPTNSEKSKTSGNHAQTVNGYKIVHKNDIVVNIILAWMGSIGVSDYDGVVSPAYDVYTPDLSKIIPHYAHYVFRTDGIAGECLKYGRGIMMMRWRTYSSEFKQIKIPFPSLKEQHRIADYLDSKCSEIDTLIENLRARMESTKEYKKAVITEAVTKGLDKDVKMKDSGVEWIGEIPEGWKVARLKQVLKTPMKYGASESGVEYSDELPRYIRITDITLDNKLKDTGKLSLTEQQAIGYLLSEKTVLFARSGATVGKTFLYKPEYGRAAFAGYMISAIPNNNKIKAEWLYYYTLSQVYWDWVNSSFSQATIQNIGADKYSNLPIVIPSLITQQQIIDYLDSKCSEIDALLQNYEDQISTLEEYKKSLIYEYVTGKKEVPTA